MKTILTYASLLIGIVSYAQLEQNHTFYQYDNLNRLTQVIYNDGTEVNYTYDDLGNRTQTTVASDDDDLTFVPDDAFEQYLIDQNYDDVLDDYVVTDNIINVITLNMNSLGISDLTGIEDFTAIENLSVQTNNISEIDVTSNLQLQSLSLSNNQLSEIDISQNTNLTTFVIDGNVLTEIDISNNSEIFFLNIAENNLTGISVENHPLLEIFYCQQNDLSSIDISQNPLIFEFRCNNNIPLNTLNTQSGGNDVLVNFTADNNPNLACIQVDDEDAANNGDGNYGDWVIDAGVEYSESCTLNIDDIELSNTLILSPNPTSNNLNITIDSSLSFSINNYLIYDMTGKLADAGEIEMKSNTSTLSVEQLQSGTYILILDGNQKNLAQRFIKL